MYPPAIASGAGNMRVQIARVMVSGAWDGITSNGFNTVFWLDEIEMGALNCGLSLGDDGQGILDFCHIGSYHFWAFGITGGAALMNVFYDGQPIAMRLGRVDGLAIRDFASFCGRLIVTANAVSQTRLHIATCMMDTDQATIAINGPMSHFHISNLYATASTNRLAPFVTVAAACPLNIANCKLTSASAMSEFLLTDNGAQVNLTNFSAIFYATGTRWAEVQRGILRITNGSLGVGGPRTVEAIAETLNGNLVIDNVSISSLTNAAAAAGPLIATTVAGQVQPDRAAVFDERQYVDDLATHGSDATLL